MQENEGLTVSTGQGAAESFRIPIIGIEIEKRADFLALTALAISLVTAGYQLFGFLQKSQLILFQPTVLLVKHYDFNSQHDTLRFGLTMAYVNNGHQGYNAAVASENLRFNIGGKEYSQHWESFRSFVQNEQGALVPYENKPAVPFSVTGGGSESHETYFVPRASNCAEKQAAVGSASSDQMPCKWKNLLPLEDFLTSTETDSQQNPKVVFTANAYIYGKKQPLAKTCTIEIDSDFRTNLFLKRWTTARCLESLVLNW